MKRYTLTGKNGNQCTFAYNEDEKLLVEFKGHELPADALMWVLDHLPKFETTLKVIAEKYKGFVLTEIPEDLSFTAFWETYNYKVGNKKRVEKEWISLTDPEKLKALTTIGRYDRYLKIKGTIEKAYPQTYLNQRRFENNFNC